MRRRAVLLGTGAVVASPFVVHAGAEAEPAARYDVDVRVEPAGGEQYVCKVSFRSGESGKVHERSHTFGLGTPGTIKVGEGRRDGSAVDLTVEVTVDDTGERAELVTRITDREQVMTTQRTSVALPKS